MPTNRRRSPPEWRKDARRRRYGKFTCIVRSGPLSWWLAPPSFLAARLLIGLSPTLSGLALYQPAALAMAAPFDLLSSPGDFLLSGLTALLVRRLARRLSFDAAGFAMALAFGALAFDLDQRKSRPHIRARVHCVSPQPLMRQRVVSLAPVGV